MAEQDMSIAKLSEEFEYFKRQYDEMEAVCLFIMYLQCHLISYVLQAYQLVSSVSLRSAEHDN